MMLNNRVESKSRRVGKWVLGLLLLTALGTAAHAQDRTQVAVAGRVTDRRGDAISGATVVLATATHSTMTTTTNSDGRFTLQAAPGSYELRVTAAGFRPEVRSVQLNAAPSQLDIALETPTLAETITVTPARAEVRLADAPVSVAVLAAKDVRNAAAQTIDDLLRQVPGFSLFRRTSSIVANPTTQGVSLRGVGASGASRTLVLQDGVPLNDAFGGWVYWDRVPRLAVERVEIVRGGASDLYGSDALSGVINVITQPPARHVFNAEASYGTHGTGEVSFFASERWRGLGVALAGEAFKSDGYFIVAPTVRGQADEEAGSDHRVLSLRLDYGLNAENAIFARGTLFDEKRRNGTQLQRNDTATESLAVGSRFKTAEGSHWQLTAFANQQRFHQSFTAVAANRNAESLTRLQFVPSRDAGLSLGWSRLSFTKHLLVAGVDVRGVRGTSDEVVYANNRATTLVSAGGRQRRAGFFVQDLIQISSRWQLAASARYDHWRDSSAASVARNLATGALQPRFFAPRSTDAFNPRLALTFRPSESLALRAAAYRAFRAPTLNELYRSFRVGDTQTLANEKLTAERLTGGEVGANWNWATAFSARLTGFWTETTNPIFNFTLAVTPTLITRERRNLGRIRSRGLEAETELNLAHYWRITAGYLFADATVRRAPQDASLVGLWLPQVPRHQFTLQTVYSHPRHITAALQFRAIGKQFDDDQNRLPLGRFAVIDAMVARPLGKYLEVFIAVQNLLDERFVVARTPLENFGMPRMLRGGVRVRFER